ncbi:Holliday junction resolvase [Escherichia coli]|nr:ORF11 [Escherichia coli K-12]CAI4143855.1 Crossover junction endodeoxyribonuclease RuvC [Escherichia coli]CAI6176168.1 Crossover junction endodeoxyribonuclease RuvC [Escherichia coli]CAI6176751.1 Crossover junction endodeoxyribonuclease RuvC [Escherichia coli]CAI6177758.1 Crossover junction endodeoxyribonuclease RuvC [Escherichia coli]
MRPAKQQNGDA